MVCKRVVLNYVIMPVMLQLISSPRAPLVVDGCDLGAEGQSE